jgi:hypothetical protein
VAQFIAEGKPTYDTALLSRYKRVSVVLQRHKPAMVSVWQEQARWTASCYAKANQLRKMVRNQGK